MEKINNDLMNNLKSTFTDYLEEYKKEIQQNVLCDILMRFELADWTRKCDYEKMTSEDIVNKVCTICTEIERDYNYSLSEDLFPLPF